MQNLEINADRLWQSIQETAGIGGTPDGGVRRLTLSEEDRLVRDWFRTQCEALGCTVSVDEVGNMFAVSPGSKVGALPIAMGSHLDTQPAGGKFDGILGVLAGLEVLRTLHESSRRTNRPLMLVNWTNEEGARFAPAMLGSGVHAGVFDRAFADSRRDADGVRFADAIDAIGGRGSVPAGETRFAAMFELHIEQGPILEREEIEIGAVTGVQAMRWYDVAITGRQAHAGSTPMEMRLDALMDASRILVAVDRLARDMGGLATVGQLSISAGSRNIVPGRVDMSVDLRHERDDMLQEMERQMRDIATAVCGPDRIDIATIWQSPAVRFNETCLRAVREGAREAGASLRDIVSGAGHDSVNISRIVPTAMIFVPCRDGLSHNPLEFASRDQCAVGAQTLLNAVLLHDRDLAAMSR